MMSTLFLQLFIIGLMIQKCSSINIDATKSRVYSDRGYNNIQLESAVGDLGVCLSQMVSPPDLSASQKSMMKSVIILGSKFADELPSQVIPKEIIRKLCTNWKPTTTAIAIDPRRIDIKSKTAVAMHKKPPTSFELQTLLSNGFIIPRKTLQYLSSISRKNSGTRLGPRKFFGAISSRVRSQYEDIRDSIQSVLAPSTDLALIEHAGQRVHGGNSDAVNIMNMKDWYAVGVEVPVGAQEVIETAQDIKANVLLADQDSGYTRQTLLTALEKTPEFEMKVAELDVHCINLEDTVGSGRKEAELLKLLHRLGSSESAQAAAAAMKTHLPAVYAALVDARAQYIADAVLALNDTRVFVLVSQYLLPSLEEKLLAAGFAVDPALTEGVASHELGGRFLRPVPPPRPTAPTSSAPFEENVLAHLRNDVEQAVLGPDLSRIANWLVQLGRTIIPWREGRSGVLASEDLHQQQLRGRSGDGNNTESELDRDGDEEQERRSKQDELFRRVSEYQKRHCWVYDDKLVGTRGDYDE